MEFARKFVLYAFLGFVVAGACLSGCSQESGEKAEEIHGETPTTTAESTGKPLSEWCAIGSHSKVTTQEGMSEVKVTGIENLDIEGKEFTLCCGEIEVSVDGEHTKEKICYDETGDNSILFVYSEDKGEYVKTMVRYLKNGESCSKMFDEDGNVLIEMCESGISSMDMPGMGEMPSNS
jgi:hypothetical protein